MSERRLPPVTQVAVVSFILVVASGIWIASHLPKHVPIAPSAVLLIASALLMVANVVSLSRVPDFDWSTFFGVARWALVAYCVIAGTLEWIFVKDGTRGGELVVLTASLGIFALHVPLLIGFTVARYADGRGPDAATADI